MCGWISAPTTGRESDDDTINKYYPRLQSVPAIQSARGSAIDAKSCDDHAGSGGLAILHSGERPRFRQQRAVRDLGERHRYVQTDPAVSDHGDANGASRACRSRARPAGAAKGRPAASRHSARSWLPRGIAAQQESFDFIVQNNLFKISGLRAAFGQTIVFPVGAMEVKANWKLVTDIPAFSGGKVALADVPNVYHVNTGSDGKQYAFVSMHIISKAVPNWTWATFEHKFNPARCDIIGCRDSFGAQTSPVQPNSSAGQGYPDCVKTAPLNPPRRRQYRSGIRQLLPEGIADRFHRYTGPDIRLGNSVTEDGFVPQSSCITCHGRAAWDNTGSATTQAGFDDNGAPLGPIQPNWYFSFAGQPPIFEGMPGLDAGGDVRGLRLVDSVLRHRRYPESDRPEPLLRKVKRAGGRHDRAAGCAGRQQPRRTRRCGSCRRRRSRCNGSPSGFM